MVIVNISRQSQDACIKTWEKIYRKTKQKQCEISWHKEFSYTGERLLLPVPTVEPACKAAKQLQYS